MYSTLTDLEEIYEEYTDYDLFKFYIPDFSLRKNINSPLRSDDDNPSFSVYVNRSGNLSFCDFGLNTTGNIFEFIKLKYGLSFPEAVEKIKRDLSGIPRNYKPKDLRRINQKTKISFTVRRATKEDREFWVQYFTIDTVKRLKIYPISHIFINGFCNRIDAYVFKVGSRVKIYRPNQKPKYFGNTNSSSIQGWHLLNPNKKKLLLVSSLKEVGVLYEQGIQAIAPNSESVLIPSKIMRFLKFYWDLEILYDWDDKGRMFAKKHSYKYSIPINKLQFKEMKTKDISDFRKEYGFYNTKLIL